MTPEQYARAKSLFIDLLDKSPNERESKLNALKQSDPEVVQEVRSLLAKHFSKTILMPTGKVSKTTVQSKSFSTIGLKRIQSSLVGGVMPIAIALGSAVFLMAIGWYLESELTRRTRAEYDEVLKSMVLQKSTLLLQWVHGNEQRMQDWGRNPELQNLVHRLDEKIQGKSVTERAEILTKADEQAKVKCVFEGIVNKPSTLESERKEESKQAEERQQLKYAIWNRAAILLADWQYKNEKAGLGTVSTPMGASILTRVFDRSSTSVELPRPSANTITKEYPLETRDQYVMFFVPIYSPLPNEESRVIGAMMIRSNIFLDEVQSLIATSVLNQSNCYLLDERGAIATNARNIEELRETSVFKEARVVHGARVMEARDPGGDLLSGFKPNPEINEWPWTKPGKTISQPKDGSDVIGYRDYRGKEVVGAWHWLDSMQRMVVLEIPKSEAFKTQVFIHRAFRFIVGIPLLISLVIAALSFRRAMTTHTLTNRSLGPYLLKEKIGEGGLGMVYSAEHKLLGRTAAIKLIKDPLSNSMSLKRFNREVRMAAKLSHPNTVSIYDFGVSRDGLLYCAMEMVNGVNLAHFVSYEPDISIDRCIWILRQIGGALEEAHEMGLIHRDIKPQNVMICHKGQMADLIKVVDFGLAKTMADHVNRDVTATRVLIGTPGFIAPERLESPWIADPRIDIFAFGVLGVYLITGKVPMIGATLDSLLMTLQLGRFSDLCNDRDFRSFVALLANCISPDPADRLRAMSEVTRKLEIISSQFPWNEDLSEKWWRAKGDDLIAYARKKELNPT